MSEFLGSDFLRAIRENLAKQDKPRKRFEDFGGSGPFPHEASLHAHTSHIMNLFQHDRIQRARPTSESTPKITTEVRAEWSLLEETVDVPANEATLATWEEDRPSGN